MCRFFLFNSSPPVLGKPSSLFGGFPVYIAEHMKSDEIINLLWTGGWDSTFRLLYLLLVKHTQVQPYYIIDADRKSTRFECLAMQNIKQRIFTEHPKIRDLLRPTRYIERFDIQPNKEITQSFERIAGPYYERLGSQYDWLARFAHQSGIKDMELSAHYRDGRGYKVIQAFVVKIEDENGSFFKIDPKFSGLDEHTLFKYFRFPIMELTIDDMKMISRKESFYDLMELTWFCHCPRTNGAPCGVCNPCVGKIEEGLGSFIPFSSRIRHHLRLYRLPQVLIHLLVKHPRLYSLAKSVKHGIPSRHL